MNKRKRIFSVGVGFLSLIFIVTLVSISTFLNPFLQAKNERSFERTVLSLPSDANEINLTDIVSFEWDALYSFSGYASTEYINGILGFKSIIKPTYQEDRSHVVFVKGGKIVCHIINGDNKNYTFAGPGEEGFINSDLPSTVVLMRRDGHLHLGLYINTDVS